MKRNDIVTINGVSFSYKGECSEWCEFLSQNGAHGYSDIHEAYGKPSSTKVAIWNNWLNYFHSTFESAYVRVNSRNCHMFSIVAFISWNGVRYKAYIYPTHHDLYKYED